MAASLRMASAAVVLALAAGGARAATLEKRQVKCPVCTEPFQAFTVRSAFDVGDVDFDLCQHAVGDQVLPHAVWTCPACRYSNWQHSFEKGVKAETRKRIAEGLPAADAVTRGAAQTQIPAWAKFELARQVLAWDGADPAALADVDRTGAWAVRLESRNFLETVTRDAGLATTVRDVETRTSAAWNAAHVDGIDGTARTERDLHAARAVLEAAQREQDPAISAVWSLAGASRLRRHGENAEALSLLERLAAAADAPDSVRATARSLAESVARERRFQRRYVAW